jgi:hypothetical protein
VLAPPCRSWTAKIGISVEYGMAATLASASSSKISRVGANPKV